MLLSLYKRFFHSLQWNAIESLAYQSVLFTHQLLLFKVTPLATYGFIGTLFAIIYSSITLLNVGLDASISPLFDICTKSKKQFLQIFCSQLIFQMLFFVGVIILALILQPLIINPIQQQLSLSLITLIGLVIIFEAIKRNLKTLLQVAFVSKSVALVEICTIVLYTLSVWTWYAVTQEVTIAMIMVPMLFISLTDVILLGCYTYRLYNTLPDSDEGVVIGWKRIVYIRLSNWLHQLSNLLYSSNFLVPFFSMTIGLAHAGLFKLISSITYFITTIIHRMFGNASSAVFAHTKTNTIAEKQATFTAMTNAFNQILYGLLIFAGLNYHKILTMNGIEANQVNWTIAYLFFFMNIIENFFIAYEKFIATEEKTTYLIGTNLVSITLLALIMWTAPYASLLMLLISFTVVRLGTLTAIGFIAWRKWSIKPSYTLNTASFISFIVFSALFFIMLHL